MAALSGRRAAMLAVAICVLLLSTAPVVAAGPGTLTRVAPLAPVIGVGAEGAIANRYIIVLEKGAKAAAIARAAQRLGGEISARYGAALNGFAARLPGAAVEALRRNPNVAWIEADRKVRLAETQSNATWGLDRIDQRNRPLNGTYVYNATGAGVTAYIIDTGIRLSHADFGGRAVSGYDAIDGGSADDCNGHGTHVAGTVGGATYGVAKGVRLVAVRVLNCQGSGTNSQVVAGINWVTSHHSAGMPAVANMSLGGGASSAIDTAVNNSIADGVTYVVAAGNSNANACNYSPARVANAITVGATTSSDARASYSNYGSCLDIFAPGSSITSTWHTSNSATNTISGTSMASPHVAGVAALYLQGNSTASPSSVASAIVSNATTGVVTSAGSGSPNRLLYSLFGGSTPPPPSGCSTLPEVYSGSLSGAGDYDYQPNGNYFYTSRSGTHVGCLDGPSGVDFDLYLWRWNGSSWVTVAQGISSGPDESVTYSGSAGYYVWRVESYSGSGSYSLGIQRP